MKKFSKILSVALLVALVLSLGVANAFAAEQSSITITDAVAGHTYTAYQIFKGDYANNKLSNIEWGDDITTAGEAALADFFKLEGTNRTVDNVIAGISALADAHKVAEAVGTNVTGGTTGSFNSETSVYTISNLDDGYYMIVDTYEPAAGETDVYYSRYMVQLVGTATVKNKADKPTVDKKIVEGQNKVDANTANIGDVVYYEITSKVPDMTGYKEYYMDFSDTLSKGLTYNPDTVVVTVGSATLEKDSAYTLTVGSYDATTGTSIAIHLKDLVSRGYAKDAAITIKYNATVNDNAVIGNVGNPNTVHLDYSNNPQNSGDGTPDNGNDGVQGITPDHVVKTFVTELQLKKVDGSDHTTPLAGAVFNIKGTEINKVLIKGERFVENEDGTWYLLKDKTYTQKEPNDATESKYESTTQKYIKEAYQEESVKEVKDVEFQVVTGSDGIIKLTGLKEGTYTFTEIQAPDGYNLLTAPLTITITSNITRVLSDSSVAFAFSATGANVTQDPADSGMFVFTVENNGGTQLPSTGGIGTTIFYVVGGVLVLAAIILLVTKKRMSE